MSRRTCAFVSLLVLAIGVTMAGCAHQPPVIAEPVPDDDTVTRIRMAPAESDEFEGPLTLRVMFPGQCAPADTLEFGCEIESEKIYTNLLLCLDVTDEDGRVRHSSRQFIDLAKGLNAAQLVWRPAGLADGTYTVRFRVEQEPVRMLAARSLVLTQTTLADVSERLAWCEKAVPELDQTLADQGTETVRPAYGQIRLVVAERALAVAKRALARDDWESAAYLVDYVERAVTTARAELAFASVAPELAQPLPSTRLAGLAASDGAFVNSDGPVFLFGGVGGPKLAGELDQFARLGLCAAEIDLDWGADGSAKRAEETGKALAEYRTKPGHADLVLFADLGLERLSGGALAKSPAMKHGNPYDITHADALTAARERIDSAVRTLGAGQSPTILSLADRPAFTLDGDRFRNGFIGSLKESYGDRYEMNQLWQSRYREFDDVPVDWNKTDRAYQCDLISYQNKLVTRFFVDAAKAARQSAPDGLVAIRMAGDLTVPGAGRADMDHEEVARSVDVVELGPPTFESEDGLALGYPGTAFHATLLTSIAPGRPTVVTLASAPLSRAQDGPAAAARTHAAAWDAVMAGANGMLAPMGITKDDAKRMGIGVEGDLLRDPDGLEGFGRAAVDVNRLRTVVAAFQQAPAEVAILWSESSRTFDGGEDYLESVKTAFEGVLWFGEKVRFITEQQCAEGGLDDVALLVLPKALAVSNAAFDKIQAYVTSGGYVVRTSTALPYEPRGISRPDVLKHTTRTFLVGGSETPLDYLRAVDMACTAGASLRTPRAINRYGYPIEGLVTRHVEVEGVQYMYVCNLRHTSVTVYLPEGLDTGRDVIGGRPVQFPMVVDALTPMLVRFGGCESASEEATPVEAG